MAHKREVRTLDERINIIEEIERNPGEKKVDAAKRLGLATSTLSSILAKKEEIRLQASKCGPASKKRKNSRESTFKELEEVLFSWYQQARASGIPVDGTILKEKATQISLRLGVENFSASNGWAARFKERHGLIFKKVCGESAGVNEETTSDWLSKLPKIIDGYEPKDIYNCDETGLFYNCLPDRTLAVKGEACHGGKMSKERLTVLLCTNSDGSDKLQPLVIGKSKNPRCFKNIKNLPVRYHANNKAWMTADMFTSFLRTFDCTMGTQCRKVLLFVDNCAAHPKDISFLRNVKVVFYPPNCTSVCQPLDMGIIKCLKQQYRKMLVRKVVGLLDVRKDDSSVVLKINILQAIHYLATSWKKIDPTVIQNCFAKCGVAKEVAVSSADEENIEEDFRKLDSRHVGFDTYASCDEQVATCGIQSVEALCEAAAPTPLDSSDDEEETSEPAEKVPSFSEAHSALETLKSFSYAHSMSEDEQETLLKMESMLLKFRSAGGKQSTIKDFFQKK